MGFVLRTIKNKPLTYLFVPLLILMVGTSYFRFVVIKDYLVSYETDCEPSEQSCYVGCDNDDCSEIYHYAIITRQAKTIENLCGVDITDCSAANSCTNSETSCLIEYCDESEGFYSCDEINNS